MVAVARADQAHNRREALAAAGRALSRYQDGTGRALHDFGRALRTALASAERELSVRRAELQQALAAPAAADDESRAACQRRVDQAEQKVRAAEFVVNTIRSACEQFQGQLQRFTSLANDATLRGHAKLRNLDRDLDRYLAAGGAGANGQAAVAGAGAVGTTTALASALAERGLLEIPVSSAGFADNPVVSWVHATRADVEWAVDRWDTVVSKVAARGGGRDELAARDERDGTTGTMRQLAGVWDMFLGSDAITVSEEAGGGLSVVDGRHRLLVAAEMGVERLPARVIRASWP